MALRMAAAIVLALSLAHPAAAQTPANAQDSIAAAWQAYLGAVRNNDRAAMVSAWTDDAVYMAPGAKTASGRPGFDALVREILGGARITEITDHTDEILVDGNVAVQRGTYVETVQPRAENKTTLHHRYLVVWQRQPTGEWKMARGMANEAPGQ